MYVREGRVGLIEHLKKVVEEATHSPRSWSGQSKKSRWKRRQQAKKRGLFAEAGAAAPTTVVARAASRLELGGSAPRAIGCFPGYEVAQIYRVRNQRQAERFSAMAGRIGGVRELWHGTKVLSALQIVESGLVPGSDHCMFGSGIYMGPFEKASHYTGEGVVRFMLRVRVALGRIYYATGFGKCSWEDLQRYGYHSLAGMKGRTASWGGTLRGDEYVVYRPEQALVAEVWEFRRMAVNRNLLAL